MSQLSQGLAFLRAAARVAPRRWRRGPLRPSWTWMFEALAEMMKADSVVQATLAPAELRRRFEAQVQPSPVLRAAHFTPGEVGGVRGHWIEPIDPAPRDVVLLYLHGGSYQFGSSTTHRETVTRIAIAAGLRAFSADYRLAPEAPLPAALDDALAAYRALLAAGTPASRLVVGGDSAGGGLAAALLCALRDAGDPLPAAGLLLCPWVDLAARGGSLVEHAAFDWAEPADFVRWADAYLAGADAHDPRASPAHASLAGLPPLFVQWGSAEMLADQVRAFVARARAAGVVVTADEHADMIHGWFFLAAMVPEARAAIDRSAAFVRARTGG